MIAAGKRLLHEVRAWAYTLPAPPILRSLVMLVYRVIHNFGRDDGSHMAAGLAFYAIFSLFPLALGTIAIAGVFVSAQDVQERVVRFLDEQIGVGSEGIVTTNVEMLTDARGALGIVAIIALFWSARAVFGAIHRVLNRAWRVTERPHFLVFQIGQVAAAAAVAVIFMSSAVLGTVGRAIAGETDDLFGIAFPWETLFTFLPLTVSTSVFLLLYRFVPDAKVRWRDAIPAALLASLLFEVAKTGFAAYLANLSSLDLVYGSVTTVVVLMLFLYVVAMVLVLGAELSSEYHASSTSGLVRFRGHWKPVRGGLASVEHRRRMQHAPPKNLPKGPHPAG
jgi:membrane protein